jgi:hypothetical protein
VVVGDEDKKVYKGRRERVKMRDERDGVRWHMIRLFLSGVGESGVLVGRDIVTVGWHGIGIFFLHILNRFGRESVTEIWMIWIFGVCCSLCMMLLDWMEMFDEGAPL